MFSDRRKVCEVEANELVREWRASGSALPAWCAQRGIDGRSLRHWVHRVERGAELRVVEMVAPRAAVQGSPIRLRVGGVTIVVDDTFSEPALTRVLRAVRAC